ncbi:hypothetical protein [Clostridium sp.]|uniref:hypothetical protein n=1 Tax=Clostridium sp. TaxID=1506 RepID=UPI002FCA3544
MYVDIRGILIKYKFDEISYSYLDESMLTKGNDKITIIDEEIINYVKGSVLYHQVKLPL